MTEIVGLVRPVADKWKQNADYLRELADRLEKGEVTEIVVVCNDVSGAAYESYVNFNDLWRLLGAIEYAKHKVNIELALEQSE